MAALRAAATRAAVSRAAACLWLVIAVALAPPTLVPVVASASEAATDGPGLPAVVRTKHRTFAIPFRLPQSKDPDEGAATQRVVLNVSSDLGATWAAAGETSPTAGSFTYTADVDGEYWFRLRAIDRKGRSRGGEGPDIRVLVDAAGPRLAARVWKGTDGEIICRYSAADDSLRIDSLVVEYRGPEDRGWKTVAADAVLARETPAHLVGETIWWAGEKVDKLAVRIAIMDESGNRTDKTFSLEPSDPQVDQSTLARELGVPALPTGAVAWQTTDDVDPSAYAASAGSEAAAGAAGEAIGSVLTGSPGLQPRNLGSEVAGWPAQAAPWTGGGQPPTPQPPQRSAGLTAGPGLAPRSGTAGLLPRADDAPAQRVATRPVSVAADPLAAAGITGAGAAGEPLTYRGRPLHLARARRFAWDYEIPAVRRAAGPLRAELWITRDGGLTWQKAAVDTDGRSPIDVELAESGFFGVRLELVADVPDADGGPRSGAEPDAWVGIDEEPPQVELSGIDRDESAAGDVLVIRYAARDPLLPANSVRLLYSPNAEGPWATITTTAANESAYRWEPGRSVPARVFVRIEAIDAAGNKGFAVSDEAISVAPTRFGGKLGGLRVLPTP
jgi:hypothetical protein